MQKIYPKISTKRNDAIVDQVIRESKGLEVQLLRGEKHIDATGTFLIGEFPEIEEITFHTDLCACQLESALIGEPDLLLSLVTQAKELIDKKKGLKVNILFHTMAMEGTWEYLIKYISDAIELIGDYEIIILLENSIDTTKLGFMGIGLINCFDNKHLKMCLDICHLGTEAMFWGIDISKYYEKYFFNLKPEKVNEYVYQIHFSDVRGRGLCEYSNVHSRVHESQAKLEYDLTLMYDFGIKDAILVTEINEDDYTKRPEMLREMKMLKLAVKRLEARNSLT